MTRCQIDVLFITFIIFLIILLKKNNIYKATENKQEDTQTRQKMLSAYYSFPAQTPENELVDERWDNDFESSIYSVTDNKHINDKRNYITPTTLKEVLYT